MSLIACQECGRIIDSDDDPDCFVEGNYTAKRLNMVLCEQCREGLDDGNE